MEAMGGHGLITLTGELTTNAKIDAIQVVKRVAGEQYQVNTNIVQQSSEISQGVDVGGAGDQGIMVGFACDENEEMVPQELYLARNLNKLIYSKFPNDGKTQVTLKNGKISSVVASFHKAKASELRDIIFEWFKGKEVDSELSIYANPAGDWDIGGFDADTGLTGRKIICDAYGPQVSVGGGAYSGKDGTKVDRSGAYMARRIAVDAVKKLGGEVIVKLAYAIGKKNPVMVSVARPNSNETVDFAVSNYDLSPQGIIDFLKLRKPQFEQVAEWGSYGNGFRWEV